MSFDVNVKIDAPAVEPAAAGRVADIIQGAVEVLAELGMNRLTAAFPTGVPVKTGNYWRHIEKFVEGPLAQLDDSGVIYGPWIEGTSSRNETSRFKGYSTFRRAAQWLQEEQVPIVAQKAVDQIVRELGG